MSELDPKVNDVAALLAGLRPSPASLDRDRIMFEAGRQSAPKSGLWPCATGILGVALLFSMAHVPEPVEKIVVVHSQVPIRQERYAASVADTNSYYRLMRDWEQGIPPRPRATIENPKIRPLEQLLDGDLDPAWKNRLQGHLKMSKGEM